MEKRPENNIDYSLIYYADNKTDGIDHNWDGVSHGQELSFIMPVLAVMEASI